MDWENNNQNQFSFRKIDDFLDNLFNKPQTLLMVLGALIIVVAIISSWFTVQTDERGVVTRFGQYDRTAGPGLHFKLPLGIEKVVNVKTTAIHEEAFGRQLPSSSEPQAQSPFARFSSDSLSKRYRSRNLDEESLMLTGDLNVADVEWVVQYRVADPKDYLFNVRDPKKNIRDISQATMRRVVGDRTVSQVLTTGRTEIAAEAKRLSQEILNKYNMGVEIVDVKLQDVNPPEKVKPSFNDVVAAKQEQERTINMAEQEYNSLIPEARGKAEQEISGATGYAQAAVNRSKGDANKFLQLLQEYKKAPTITRKRLYLETVEKLMRRIDAITIVDKEVKGVLPVFTTSESIKNTGVNK